MQLKYLANRFRSTFDVEEDQPQTRVRLGHDCQYRLIIGMRHQDVALGPFNQNLLELASRQLPRGPLTQRQDRCTHSPDSILIHTRRKQSIDFAIRQHSGGEANVSWGMDDQPVFTIKDPPQGKAYAASLL